MIPNPILKVLSSMATRQVRSLLMGGQACVFYGAAEFSRDSDFAVLAEPENLQRLQLALQDLEAEEIAVPSLSQAVLERGHAVHFRCRHAACAGLRIDVMSRLRGVAPFEDLWQRRTTVEWPDGTVAALLAVPDLVSAKKTQRDKDWPMIRRLVEANYFANYRTPSAEQIRFWFRELRSPNLLVDLARELPDRARAEELVRPLLKLAREGDAEAVEQALRDEEARERTADRAYWAPLRQELAAMRRERIRPASS